MLTASHFARPRFRLGLAGLATLLLVGGLVLSLTLVTPTRAASTTFTVTDCSSANASGATLNLDNALTAAQQPGESGDTITFNCSGFILLDQTLTITTSLTIDGKSGSVGVDGGNALQDITVASTGNLTLDSFTIQKGTAGSGSGGGISNAGTLTLNDSHVVLNTTARSAACGTPGVEEGGGMYNTGTLSLNNSTVEGNTGECGGGIFNEKGGMATLSNSTVANNTAIEGGGIENFGTMTLSNSTVANNTGGFGGGIENSGTMTMTNSTVAHNTATQGGGIFIALNTLTMTNSTVAHNSATQQGGGIFNQGTLTMTNSTVAHNSAGEEGGGIENTVVPTLTVIPSTLTLTNSTVANNLAGTNGGGIENEGINTLTLTNSTVANNSATQSGGGIANYAGMLTLTNSTVANNSATQGGDGILNDFYGTVTSSGSLLADNPAGKANNCVNSLGTISDGGYNLENGTDCGFSAANHSLTNTDPQLDPSGLLDNGGPTQTIALQAGSPAIDAGPPAASCPTTDQRGVSRLDNGEANCDIGAYESSYDDDLALQVPKDLTVDATTASGTRVTYTVTATDPDESSTTPSVSCVDAANKPYPTGANVSVTFPIGATQVTCTVTDSDDVSSPVKASFTVTVKGPVQTGAQGMALWGTKTGQTLISNGATTNGVCNVGTWLRQYAPFQNLSATATCSKVASYVASVLNVASNGTSAGGVLKGQLLATALDVYFSDPSLGGNKLNAPVPIGGVTIDLTYICTAPTTTSGGAPTCGGTYEIASSAFGGATSLTISQMLSSVSSQFQASTGTWYGGNQTTTGLARDAFAAMNSQWAFAP
jgi:hypothetical protein